MEVDPEPPWIDWMTLLKKRAGDRSWDSLSWLSLRALASSANDIVGKGSPQLVNDLRVRWVAKMPPPAADGPWDHDLVVSMPSATSFLVVGDTGEQDASQYAVVPALVANGDAAFMVICSDVIYPAGDVNDYVDGFYLPYEAFKPPILAIPGNHDWYDGLDGFMWHFCGASPLPPEAYGTVGFSLRQWLAKRMWRKSSAPKHDLLNSHRQTRAAPDERWKPRQPGPYFAIDLPDLLVVCIDTGITGEIDWQQGEWLARVSKSRDKDKILLTGKPIMVNHRHEPGPITCPPNARPPRYPTVDAIVRDPAHRYVAAIGGDIHNYQHYTVRPKAAGRPAAARERHYLVSGGGGAFMSATHPIPPGHDVSESSHEPCAKEHFDVTGFSCYPTREDSLRHYGVLLVPRLWQLVRGVAAAVAGLVIATAALHYLEPAATVRDVALVAGAALVAVWLGLLWHGIGRLPRTGASAGGGQDTVAAWRRRGTVVMALVAGAVAGLATRWVVGPRFEVPLSYAAALIAFSVVIAWLLRLTGVWRSAWLAAVAYLVQVVVILAAVYALAERLEPAGGLARILGVAGCTLLALLTVPFLVDRAQRLSPHHYRGIVMALACLAVAGVSVTGALADHWAPRAVVAASLVLAALVIGIVIAHLMFLGAFALLWRPADHSGRLSADESEQALNWRDGGDPPAARVKRIVNLVHPGSGRPNGPIQQKVSEIFDRDAPPFFKNFLRLDLDGLQLTITVYGVTGNETKREDVTAVEQIPITLRAAAQSGG